MSKLFEVITPNVSKLYTISMLADLRGWKEEFQKIEELCAQGAKMEADDTLFLQEEDFVDRYLAAQEQKKVLEERAQTWRADMCAFFDLSEDRLSEKLEDMLGGGKGKGKKKKASAEELDMNGQMQRWADMFSGNLWGENNQLGGWSGRYLDALADYVCSNEGVKNPAFDAYIKPKIEQINQDLKRKPDYKSAQSVLLEKLEERKRKNPKIDLDNVLERYMENVLVERANTFGADNHFFRCMASGNFYIPDEKVSSYNYSVTTSYSDYFLKNYGEKFYLPAKAKTKTKKVADGLDVNKMLGIITDTYGKEVADDIKRTLRAKGISEADFRQLNGYDLAKILQKSRNAIAHNSVSARISDFCEGIETPYQKQARNLGMMLTIGKEVAEAMKKGGNESNILRKTADSSLKSTKIQYFSTAWKENFQDQFPNYNDFAKECMTVYNKISSDFSKNGYGEYYEKWVEAMTQKGDYFPKFEGIDRPYEINIHHKMPVKMAKMLDRPADINDVANYLMFVEFKAPSGEKLTKHLQEHAKESGSTASLGTNPDARFYCSSGGVTISHQNYKEPESFTKLRAQQARNNNENVDIMALSAGKERA